MQLVLDSNIILSALIKDSKTRELLLDLRLEFFSPEFLLRESKKHILADDEVRQKISMSDSEIFELPFTLFSRIKILDKEQYLGYFDEASKLVKHDKDIPYIALSLKLNLPLWSNDKNLKKQSKVKVFNTKDLIEELSKLSE